MLKTSLFALFVLSMATLTISASSLPVPGDAQHVGPASTLDIATLE